MEKDYEVLTTLKDIKGTVKGQKDNIKIEGHRGTWYIIDEIKCNGQELYLIEHETYGDEAACLIVTKTGKIKLEDVWNGFNDLDN